LKSMTGYSRIVESVRGVTYSLELKSVNHKYLNVSFSLPSLFSSFEFKSLPIIREYVKRGSLLVKAEMRGDFESELVQPDLALAKAYYKAIIEIKKELNLNSSGVNIGDIMGVQDLFRTNLTPKLEKTIWEGFEQVLRKGLELYNRSRESEGEKLKEYLLGYLDDLENTVKKMHSYESANRDRYREIILERIGEFSDVEIDEQRLEQEIIFMIQRSDIGEELSRLKGHILRARELLNTNEAVGSELDFIFQELGREMNTLSNKSKIPEILNPVVKAKSIIKKLREQVQNAE